MSPGSSLRFVLARATLSFALLEAAAVRADAPATNVPAKDIVILQSYAPNVGPFNAVKSALSEKLGAWLSQEPLFRIVLVDMDATRHEEVASDPQKSVAGMRQKLGGRDVALVITVGDPAARLLMRTRREAFPGKPVLFVACDAQTAARAVNDPHTAVLAQQLSGSPAVSNILRLLPATTNIVVVTGTTPPEREIRQRFSLELMGFTNRVTFYSLSELPFDEILSYCSNRPPHSAIFFNTFARDASGRQIDYDFALRRLVAVANAPVFTLFESQFGDGVVGGPLMPDTTLGVQAAEVAIRILKGERPEDIVVPVSVPAAPVYNARELARWGISEDRLPPGSQVQFRPLSLWSQFKWQVSAMLAALFLLASLSVGLALALRHRRSSEAALVQSMQRFRQVADIAGEFIWEVNAEGRYTYASPSVERILGYTPDELVGRMHFYDLLEPSVRAERRAETFEIFGGRQTFRDRPTANVSKRGEIVHLKSSGGPLLDAGGRLAGYRGVDMDVTAQRRAEEDSREQHVLMDAVFNSVPGLLYLFNADGRLVRWNRQYEHLTGYAPGELRNFRIEDWFAKEDQAQVAAAFTKAFSEGVLQVELNLRLKSGALVPHAFTGSKVIIDGKPFLVGMGFNTSERKRTEERIRQLTHVIEQCPVSVVMTDLQGQIVYVNRKFTDVSGYTYEESIGKNPRLLKSGEMSAAAYQELWACLTRGGTWRGEFHNRRKNGELYWESAVISPLFDPAVPGRITHYVGVKEDISDLKRLDQEVVQKRNELAHISRVTIMSELSTSLAHELNQPLAIILTNAQAAQRLLAQDPPDLAEAQEILADIVSEDQRAGEVIRRLRALLKPGQTNLQPLLVFDLIAEVLQIARSELIDRGIAVCQAPVAPSLRAVGDRVQLQQVLLNLILNASEAMSDNPPAHRQLSIAAAALDGKVRISISDNGRGLPAEVDKVFAPFYTTKKEGMGLGLSICRSIADVHHGRLWAEPGAGRGATFHLELPVADGA